MHKRGQIAIFIIVGSIILISLILLIYFKSESIKSLLNKQSQETINIPKELQVVTNYIDNCLKENSEEAIYQIGRSGGYYQMQGEYIVFFTETIPYYYSSSKENIPKLELIEKGISNFIEDFSIDCFNLKDFQKKGFEISQGEISVSTKIGIKDINIKIIKPIKIKKNQNEFSIDNFNYVIRSNFMSQYNVGKELVNIYSKKPGYICLTCLEELPYNNLSIDVLPIADPSVEENDIFWILIDDREFTVNNKTLTLRFVIEKWKNYSQ